MTIGILSLQGAVSPHEEKFAQIGISTRRVRCVSDLKELAGIVLPGGESSTMIHLIKQGNLWEELKRFILHRPSWGLCAGAILLARKVLSPAQDSFAAIDIQVTRNAYGRQNESFISNLTPTPNWIDNEPIEGVFIRAPKITEIGNAALPLLTHLGQPVMVQQGHVLATTFHPELSENLKLHQFFAKLCQEAL